MKLKLASPVLIRPDGLSNAEIREAMEVAERLRHPLAGFREFLNYWQFLDQDTGTVRILGETLWPAQEEFVRAAVENPWVFYLKARQLGESTMACAFDGYVLRVRDRNGRVHVFSRRDDEAKDLLKIVRFGMDGLPSWLSLPLSRESANEVVWAAGEDDRRLLHAYPTGKATGRGATCGHAHIDEWAIMEDPQGVWAAVEPSISKESGSCHLVTTGMGPTNYSSAYWETCEKGEGAHYPCFIPALNSRPDYSPEFLRRKKSTMDNQAYRSEYPETWRDAISGGAHFFFLAKHLDMAGVDALGLQPAKPKHNYIKAWDLGLKDASVGICLDCTDAPMMDVVAFVYLKGVDAPVVQRNIERLHKDYPGITVIEDNNMGEWTRQSLDIPSSQLIGWHTSRPSKAKILAGLYAALGGQYLKWKPEECPQLTTEMKGYRLPDDSVVQDCVMTLAIAVEHAPAAFEGGGRIIGVIRV
jgi:hypothetical protein